MSYAYKRLFTNVRKIVNKYDPDGLIEGGAPEDEYDSYVCGVISIFVNKKVIDAKNGALLLKEYFVGKLGKDAELGDEKYLEFAKEIILALKDEYYSH